LDERWRATRGRIPPGPRPPAIEERLDDGVEPRIDLRRLAVHDQDRPTESCRQHVVDTRELMEHSTADLAPVRSDIEPRYGQHEEH
jgi:hypothetical protein